MKVSTLVVNSKVEPRAAELPTMAVTAAETSAEVAAVEVVTPARKLLAEVIAAEVE